MSAVQELMESVSLIRTISLHFCRSKVASNETFQKEFWERWYLLHAILSTLSFLLNHFNSNSLVSVEL